MAQTPISNPYLLLQQITDQYIRKNFENLQAYFNTQNQFLDFKFFEQIFTEATTGLQIAHGLSYIPLDVLVSQITGTGTVTFQRGKFTSTTMVLDATGPCRIRFYAGTFSRYTSPIQLAATDTQQATASYFTSPLSTKGDLLVYGETSTRFPLGTDGYVLTADSTQAQGLRWAQISPTGSTGIVVITKNANYTATSTEDVIICDASAGSFTITLQAVTSRTKPLIIKKAVTDTSFNIVTISRVGSDTIDGATSIKANTFGETYELTPDASTTWYVTRHEYSKIWTSFTPHVTGGFSSLSNEFYQWMRDGATIRVRASFTPGSTNAVIATIGLPSTALLLSNANGSATDAENIGQLQQNNNGTQPCFEVLSRHGDNYFTFGCRTSAASIGLAPVNANSMITGGVRLHFWAVGTVQGWT